MHFALSIISVIGKKYKAIEYYKRALFFAYYTNDTQSEVHYYERLAMSYMDVGDSAKMKDYYHRVTEYILEP